MVFIVAYKGGPPCIANFTEILKTRIDALSEVVAKRPLSTQDMKPRIEYLSGRHSSLPEFPSMIEQVNSFIASDITGRDINEREVLYCRLLASKLLVYVQQMQDQSRELLGALKYMSQVEAGDSARTEPCDNDGTTKAEQTQAFHAVLARTSPDIPSFNSIGDPQISPPGIEACMGEKYELAWLKAYHRGLWEVKECFDDVSCWHETFFRDVVVRAPACVRYLRLGVHNNDLNLGNSRRKG